jgi:hypothetical protein
MQTVVGAAHAVQTAQTEREYSRRRAGGSGITESDQNEPSGNRDEERDLMEDSAEARLGLRGRRYGRLAHFSS